MKVVILAAGLGTRMKDLTKRTPKCLLKIDQQNLLEKQVEVLKNLDLKDIVIVIGGEGECWTLENQKTVGKIVQKVIINPRNKEKNCSYSLKLFLDSFKEEDLLIIDGDVFFNEDLIEKFLSSKNNGIIVKEITSNMPTNRVLIDKNQKVLGVGRNIKSDLIHGGIIHIKKEDINLVKELIEAGGYDKDLSYMLNELSKEKEIYSLQSKDLININTPEDLERVRINLKGDIGVIWDFDGVIFDSAPFKIEAYKKAFSKLGIKIQDKDFLENTGLGAVKAFEKICSKYEKNCNFEEFCREKNKIYREIVGPKITTMPGVKNLVSLLKENRVKQAIATSSTRDDVILVLKYVGLIGIFDAIVTIEEVSKSKPDPEIFLKAAEKLGINKNACLVIEDSIHGILAAKAAGMKCLVVTKARRIDEDLSRANAIVNTLEGIDRAKIQSILCSPY